MALRRLGFREHLLALKNFESRSAYKKVSTTADVLLTIENKNRCLECMKKTPSPGIKWKQTKSANTSAAVLIPICIDAQGETSILYTRRSGHLSRHMRQISFPGGLKDASDADFIECALRETEEEIGLSRDIVEIWGTGTLLTPPHSAAIMPVFGTVKNFNIDELNLNTAEVEEAFAIPISSLVTPSALKYTQFKSGFSAPVFLVNDYRIWGITGFLTHSFLNCFMLRDQKNRIKYIKPFKHHR